MLGGRRHRCYVSSSRTEREKQLTRASHILGSAALILAALAAPASAQPATAVANREPVAESGVAGGAPYRIDVPARWNGGLVVLYHGYEVAGQRRPDPFWGGRLATAPLLQRGYAVIQSAYSRQGWAVAEALTDTAALRAAFERRFGRPTRVFAAGFSMGGHLALATIERDYRSYDGALSMCGVNLPATGLFDRAVGDLAAAAALFPGTVPDLDAASATPGLDPEALGRAMAGNPRAAQQLAAWTGIEARDLPGALWLYRTAVRELRDRAGGFPGSNVQVRYRGFGDDAAFNRRVHRYRADPAALPYVRANAGLTGRLHDPVVLLYNAYDDLVSGRTRTFYPAAVRAAGSRPFLTILTPVGRGHCAFTPDQVGAAFDRLVEQVDRRAPDRRGH